MRELFRSTPFRITVVLGAAFFAAVLVAAFVAYTLIENELGQRMDQSITDSFNVIGEDYGDSDQADLIETVQSHAASTINHDRVYALAGPGDKLLAGNIAAIPTADGWLTVAAAVTLSQPSAVGIAAKLTARSMSHGPASA